MRLMPSGRMLVGAGIMSVAVSSRRDIRHEVSPFLAQLSRDLDETADLAVLYAGEALYIDQYVSPRVLRAVAHIGVRFPLHCTANGKALLAALPPAEAAAILPCQLEARTNRTVTDHQQLLDEIAEVRRTGIAYDIEEYEIGVAAVGAFVRDVMGDTVSIAAVAPMARFKVDEDAIVAAVLRTRAAAQAALLGDPGPLGDFTPRPKPRSKKIRVVS